MRNFFVHSIVRIQISERLSDAAGAGNMVRIAREKALPFEPLVPNAETAEAIKAVAQPTALRLYPASHRPLT